VADECIEIAPCYAAAALFIGIADAR